MECSKIWCQGEKRTHPHTLSAERGTQTHRERRKSNPTQSLSPPCTGRRTRHRIPQSTRAQPGGRPFLLGPGIKHDTVQCEHEGPEHALRGQRVRSWGSGGSAEEYRLEGVQGGLHGMNAVHVRLARGQGSRWSSRSMGAWNGKSLHHNK